MDDVTGADYPASAPPVSPVAASATPEGAPPDTSAAAGLPVSEPPPNEPPTAETPPVETSAVADPPPGETAVVETSSAETPPAETLSVEAPPVEQPAAEQAPVESGPPAAGAPLEPAATADGVATAPDTALPTEVASPGAEATWSVTATGLAAPAAAEAESAPAPIGAAVVAEVDAATPTIAAPEAVELAAAEPEAAGPKVAEPEAAQPGAIKSEAAESEGIQAEAADLTASEPEDDGSVTADDDDTTDDDGPSRAGRAVRAPDPVCAAAIDLARAAAAEEAGADGAVGEHLGVEAEGDRLVLHRFACLTPAYRGWVWAVIAARAPRVRKVTVDDVVLMPGEDALLAPPWVPWSQRLRPGDVGVGDLLPTAVDDARLALRSSDTDEFVDTDAFTELGLGRPRVLSALGREEASARWYAGEPGPDAHVAKVAPATCLTCGFHVRLVGALGRLFGVCANELAPDDARVTAIDHGCGAHSEALVAPSAHPESVPFDEDPSDLEPTDVELVGVTAGGAAPDAGSSPTGHTGRPEPYGHA